MSKALKSAGHLKPEIRLAQALSEFEAALSSIDKARLRSSKSQVQSRPPTVDDVMRLTAEVDAQAKGHIGSGRCFGPRLTYMLQAVQQYVALGDILVGGSQNLIACGVWSVVRITILAATLSASSMERLSLLFMAAGRSAPRYQRLALLYARSRHIRGYLAEYMTTVVQVCHYYHDISHKSIIGQIRSSFSDSKIRDAEEQLNRWAQLIKDEAYLLLAQTTEREAAENSSVRKWLNRSVESNALQKKIDKRLQWLNAFSTFDYETPWKQARKRGSSSFFIDIPSYRQWKEKKDPPSLLLYGKMGCGKSVIMANMIDDLHISCPEDATIYFFCRHDIPESLKARTVFGSFAAQISQRHLQTETMDAVFINAVPSMSFDKILEFLPIMIRRMQAVRLVLDGVDECPQPEFDLICTGLRQLRAECNILSCVSCIDQAYGLQAKFWRTEQAATIPVPNDNSDIREFVETELQRLQKSGELSIGDPRLIATIQEALLRGADGMFLWVALQLDTICAARTDNLIRRALEDLPRTLGGTFHRILQNSKQKGRCFQTDILKILVGAKRPLRIAEFREALSVTPGDTSWDRGNMINNIYATLSCCGSLVIIDEEEGTVRLLHQSVVQFLHNKTPESVEWSFSAQTADVHLGDITVTYLNYGVFDKRISTRVVPQMDAGKTPKTIVSEALKPFGTVGKRLADATVKSRRMLDRDIGVTLSVASNPRENSMHMPEDFEFLAYASGSWLLHTGQMSDTSLMTPLFMRLLNDSDFGDLPWNKGEDFQNIYTVELESTMVLQIPPRLRWAILHSHSLVFSAELRGRSGIKALLSIAPYLNSILKLENGLKLSAQLSNKLLRITTLFKAFQPTERLIQMHGYSIGKYMSLLRDHEYGARMWAALRASCEDLHDVEEPLLEEAIMHDDVRTVLSLLKRRAKLEVYRQKPPLRLAMRSCFYKPENIFMVLRMLQQAKDPNVSQMKFAEVFWFFHAFSTHASYLGQRGLTLSQRLKFDENEESRGVRMAILERACERGEYHLARLIAADLHVMKEEDGINLVLKTLATRSSERANIVESIILTRGLSPKDVYYSKKSPILVLSEKAIEFTLTRLAQLRDWNAILSVERTTKWSIKQSIHVDPSLFYLCLDSRDWACLYMICKRARSWHSHQSLLAYTTALNLGSPEDVCGLLKFVHLLQMDQRHKTDATEISMSFEVWSAWACEFADVNVPFEYSECWERTAELVPRLCVRVLHYLANGSFFLGHIPALHNLAVTTAQTPGHYMLDLLDAILKDLSDSVLSQATWSETFTAVLEGFAPIGATLKKFPEDYLYRPLEGATQRVPMGIMKIAATLVRDCFPLKQVNDLDPAVSAHLWSVWDRERSQWSQELSDSIESLLYECGIIRPRRTLSHAIIS